MKIFSHQTNNRTLRIAIAAIWLSPLLIFLWILYLNYNPQGTFSLTYIPGKDNAFVQNFASKEPDVLIGNPESDNTFQLITVSPLYFDVLVPREFTRARVSIQYQNPDQQSVINLGVRQPNNGYLYADMARHIPKLEQLGPYWKKTVEGDVILWQKDIEQYVKFKVVNEWKQRQISDLKKVFGTSVENLSPSVKERYNAEMEAIEKGYAERLNALSAVKQDSQYVTVGEFFQDLPDIKTVGEFNYQIQSDLTLPNYTPKHTITQIPISIRGKQNIYTYIGPDEELAFNFFVRDFNHQSGADPFVIRLTDVLGNEISTYELADDGNTGANDTVLPERVLAVSQPNLEPGVYRLNVDVLNDDIFITNIETFQHKIVFRNRLYLAENEVFKAIIGEGPYRLAELYTNSTFVRFRTDHSNGLQRIQVGAQAITLDAIGDAKTVVDLGEMTKITSQRNDVVIEGDGFFSFTAEQFFDPLFNVAVPIETTDDIDALNFIIARYPQISAHDGWLQATAEVEVPTLYFSKNQRKQLQAQFILSMPDLSESGKTLRIKSVRVDFEKEPFTLQNILPRIINRFK